MIHQLSMQLPKPTYESTVFSLAKNTQIDQNFAPKNYQTKYAYLNCSIASTGFSLPALWQFRQAAKQADIIHYHFPNPFADILHYASGIWQLKKPSVLTYHSDIIKQKRFLKIYQPLMHRFLNDVNCIVATSQNYLDSSLVLQEYQDKTKVVPIGIQDVYQEKNINLKNINLKNINLNIDLNVDQTVISPFLQAPSFFAHPNYQQRFKYWQEKLPQAFFLFVGSLRYYKGLDILLDALKILKNQTDFNNINNLNNIKELSKNYKFVIAGDGVLADALKAKALAYGLDNIMFIQDVSDLDKNILYQLAYAFIFPSHLRTEAFGISLLEAAMHGKAALTFEIGTGSSFINQHQKTGWVLELGAENLARGIVYFMSHPNIVQAYGSNARQRFLAHFQVPAMSEQYADIYQSLLFKK